MNPLKVINEFYKPGSRLHSIYMNHSSLVTQKALDVAQKVKHLNPDIQFIRESAMLHDIGIFMTDTPSIGCYGEHLYMCHGILGRVILEQKGLHLHAMVCERHVGVGLSIEDIKESKLPLPLRDMRPVTLEEKIVAYADNFYSKNDKKEKSIKQIVHTLEKYGKDKVEIFQNWARSLENICIL